MCSTPEPAQTVPAPDGLRLNSLRRWDFTSGGKCGVRRETTVRAGLECAHPVIAAESGYARWVVEQVPSSYSSAVSLNGGISLKEMCHFSRMYTFFPFPFSRDQSGWSQDCYRAKDNFELPSLLLLPSKCWITGLCRFVHICWGPALAEGRAWSRWMQERRANQASSWEAHMKPFLLQC